MQDYVEKGYFKIVKESTKTNWADIGTKSLNGPRVAELLRIMPGLAGGMSRELPRFGICAGARG